MLIRTTMPYENVLYNLFPIKMADVTAELFANNL